MRRRKTKQNDCMCGKGLRFCERTVQTYSLKRWNQRYGVLRMACCQHMSLRVKSKMDFGKSCRHSTWRTAFLSRQSDTMRCHGNIERQEEFLPAHLLYQQHRNLCDCHCHCTTTNAAVATPKSTPRERYLEAEWMSV